MSSLLWDTLQPLLHPWLYEALVSLEYPAMTPVQASTIPLFSRNKDVIVESVTGSGKTLSFVVPVLQHVSNRIYGELGHDEKPTPVKKGHFLAIVVAPTRELASQIKDVFDRIVQYLPEDKVPIRTQLVVGSLSSTRQNLEDFLLSRSQIMVGTPGRLNEILSSVKVSTASVEVAVLDEADRLLDLSFENEIESILKMLPKQRRTGLYSATLSAAGDRVFRTGMMNPVRIYVQNKSSQKAAPTSLSIQYMLIDPERKLSTFLRLVNEYRFRKCIVYFPTCASVKLFHSILTKLGYDEGLKLFALHGQLSTQNRMKTLNSFLDGDASEKKFILMTTDVAARGIDVPDVDLVIQLDPPTDPDMFLHRCGRTGRANKSGCALVFLNKDSTEEEYVGFMEVKNVAMTEMEELQTDELHERLLEKVHKYMLEDRARHEAAVKAYVGYVRYYQKHIASSIFRLQSLDYLGIARMYGLLRLPKMPETKYIPSEKFPEDGWLTKTVIDMDTYAYKDEKQEKARLENLEEMKQKLIKDAKLRKLLKKKNESWSSKAETKDSKAIRREKLQRKREAIQKQIMEEPSSEDEDSQQDWKEMVRHNKKQKTALAMQGSFDDL